VPTLLPATPAARAVAPAVTAEMHSGFQSQRSRMPMNKRKDYSGHGHSPEVDADIARIVAIWTDCRARFGDGGPYLFGRFSLADAAFAPVCFRFQTYAVKPDGAAGAYLATMLANPHMQAWEAAARDETESIPAEDLYG
jgi:glutathione S-transferase